MEGTEVHVRKFSDLTERKALYRRDGRMSVKLCDKHMAQKQNWDCG